MMHLIPLLISSSALALAQDIVFKAPRSVSIPTTKPYDAIEVPKDFVGFSIESAFLNNFDNIFSNNLVSALASRMSQPPILRIGGTSGDNFRFNPAQTENTTCDQTSSACPNGHKAKFVLGPSYFEGYKSFPDAKMIIQAPLTNPTNVSNSLDYVWQAWHNLGKGDRVAGIALGNEVEYIYRSGVDEYVKAALALEASIVGNLSLSGDAARIFEAGNSASGTMTTGKNYNVEDILDAGMDENDNIATTAEHWYQVSDTHLEWNDTIMQERMINHTAISDRFEKYMPSLNASLANGIDYTITEDAAVLGGAPVQISGGFGYTLWAVDFNLAGMARGVARVGNLAGRPTASRVFWVPDDSGGASNPGPQVRAPYPAAIFVADFVGKERDASAVMEIGVDSDVISAYAMYDAQSNALQRVALVNMQLYNGNNTAPRESETFQVSVGDAVKSVKTRRLRADKGVAAMGFDFGGPEHNVTYAGEQWSYTLDDGNGHFPGGQMIEDVIEVKDGVVSIDIPESEAVIMFV